MLKASRMPFGLTLLILVATGFVKGWGFVGILALLGVLEITLSFDNAFVNSLVLRRMSLFWQNIFLTIGILIAVFGMRFVLPVLIVVITSHLGFGEAVSLALHHPVQYSIDLKSAHQAVSTFGGVFLLMIWLNFLLDTEREVHWFAPLERFGARCGRGYRKVDADRLSDVLAVGVILLASLVLAGPDKRLQVSIAGIVALALYRAVEWIGDKLEPDEAEEAEEAALEVGGPTAEDVAKKAQIGKLATAGLGAFLYLEVLDATMSFDGVTAAFAITNNVIQIAIGLGIGALFIRSWTVHLTRSGVLDELIYLEHGAMYAIGTLAIIQIVQVHWQVPELVTSLMAVVLIGSALASSWLHNRREAAAQASSTPSPVGA